MVSPLYRPVCDLLGCLHPIVSAGMGGVARSELVVAVTQAGGFGFLGMVREPVGPIRSEVEALRARGINRYGVNLIPAATDRELLDAQLATCIELRVPVMGLFWDVPVSLVQRLRDAGIVVVCQVGSVTEACAAEHAGAHILIAQGVEAGGHVRGNSPLYELLPEVVAATTLPVLAAGGLVDGADLATVLSLGAQGAVFGTALVATTESFAHDYHKQRLVAAGADDTRLTEAFHINWPRGAAVRVLANSVTNGERGDPSAETRVVIGEEQGRPIYLFSTDSPLRSMTGDFEAMALYAGKGVGRVGAVIGAADRVRAIAADATALLEPRAPSPVCLAHEMDRPRPRSPAGEELLLALNELLEAERAGARVALRTAAEAPEALKALIMDIQRDEARWCGVLTKAVQQLQGVPSRKTGAFYEKAMAICDISARLAFLNRGQSWVVRKLDALLPNLQDDHIRADLAMMLASHERNITLVADRLKAGTT